MSLILSQLKIIHVGSSKRAKNCDSYVTKDRWRQILNEAQISKRAKNCDSYVTRLRVLPRRGRRTVTPMSQVRLEVLVLVVMTRRGQRTVTPMSRVRHDNRLVNLRIATKHQNSQNVKKRDGTVHRGVHWENFTKKYKAQITVQNKCINLGRFETIEEAITARDEAEKLYHGEFSPLLCRSPVHIPEPYPRAMSPSHIPAGKNKISLDCRRDNRIIKSVRGNSPRTTKQGE